MSVELRFGDSTLMLADEFPEMGIVSPQTLGGTYMALHLMVDDVDRVWQRALDAGAEVFHPLQNSFWGERHGQVIDPFGHRWGLAQHLRDVSPQEMVRAAQEMFATGGECLSASRQPGATRTAARRPTSLQGDAWTERNRLLGDIRRFQLARGDMLQVIAAVEALNAEKVNGYLCRALETAIVICSAQDPSVREKRRRPAIDPLATRLGRLPQLHAGTYSPAGSGLRAHRARRRRAKLSMSVNARARIRPRTPKAGTPLTERRRYPTSLSLRGVSRRLWRWRLLSTRPSLVRAGPSRAGRLEEVRSAAPIFAAFPLARAGVQPCRLLSDDGPAIARKAHANGLAEVATLGERLSCLTGQP